MKKLFKKIKCFLGLHELKRIYTRRTKWNRLLNRHTMEYQVFKCKNCLIEKEKGYKI